jgi:AcrR family transcriptional regulator
MYRVSTAYVETGRTLQKQRTRDLLLRTASELIKSGDTPRVEDVAEAAGVSRTTAYRYFPTQADLLGAAFPETATDSMLPADASNDPQQRVASVAAAIVDMVGRNEAQQRAMLRLSLGDVPHELPLRQGRAIGWFSEALEPLRAELGADAVHRLALALRSVCGIEARVWLRDVAKLSSADIRALQLWMSDALCTHARSAPPPR